MPDTAERTKLDKVYRHLHGEIVRGRFQTGERLPTEEELADRFGFSRTTVAKALRQLAQQGFVERRRRAGSFVRAGSAVRSQRLGAMICGAAEADIGANIFVPISRAIAKETELAGYSVAVHDPSRGGADVAELRARCTRMAREMIESQVAGVLMVPYEILPGHEQSVSADAADLLTEAGIPLVLVDRDLCRYPHRSRYDLVAIDHRRAGCILTEHLLRLGCRRIDFVAAEEYGWAQEARIAGYFDAFHNAGLKPECAWVHHGHVHDRAYVDAIVRDRRVEAVAAVNDATALLLVRAAVEAGRRVPDDLRVVGFDDLPMCRELTPPLTTIHQPCADLGAVAVRMLFDRMRHPNRRTMDVNVTFDLVVRGSCGGDA